MNPTTYLLRDKYERTVLNSTKNVTEEDIPVTMSMNVFVKYMR
jgi:hypothetical protein